MNKDLTEEEMRQALFGSKITSAPDSGSTVADAPPAIVGESTATPIGKKLSKAFTNKLKVTLHVGNEYEGKTIEIIHDTLSRLLAEQEAVKAARKKFRYVEVISVKSM
ncbi:hypothetical protein [Pseudomonas abietaniphila]